MGYQLGVDLGTTFTAAAVCRDGRAEMVTLGNRSASVPSVILLREDETILVGDAASRRGVTQPDRLAREFKRRLGDTVPIFLGGVPYSAESLMAKLLAWVLAEVSAREGGPPDRVAISHPANWGPYKIELLHQSVRLADLPSAIFVTEPQAAAVFYASQARVEPGAVVAVYDLGGGTFDAAVLRKTDTGFEHLGQPEGIERLGGIDFDAAVFAHVQRVLGEALAELDPDDPTVLQALARLRGDCSDAKEALSVDTDTSIPVLLPSVQTEVRLTRGEFEGMVRPALADSVGALHRALRSAGVEPSDVSVVLLVGGSSRIPMVAQLVGAEVSRPVAIDAHPKHSVALGAALTAQQEAVGSSPASPPAPTPGVAPSAPPPAPAPAASVASPLAKPQPTVPPPRVAPPPPATPVVPPLPVSRPPGLPSSPAPSPPPPPVPAPVASQPPARSPAQPPPSPPPVPPPVLPPVLPPVVQPVVQPPAPMAPSPSPAPQRSASPAPAGGDGPGPWVIGLAIVAVIMVIAAIVVLITQGGENASALPADCRGRSTEVACIDGPVTVDDGNLSIPFATDTDLRRDGARVQFFFDHVEEAAIGTGSTPFETWTAPPPFTGFTTREAADAQAAGAGRVCVRLTDSSLRPTEDSGNCSDLPDEL